MDEPTAQARGGGPEEAAPWPLDDEQRSVIEHVSSGHTAFPGASIGPYSLVEGNDLPADELLEDRMEAAAPPAEEELAWLRSLPWWRRPHPMWLLPVIFVFSLSLGIVIAPRMELLLAISCEQLGMTNTTFVFARIPSDTCRRSVEAQRMLSMIQLVLLTSTGVGSAISAGFWAKLSERKGRRNVLAISVLGVIFMDVFVLVQACVPAAQLPLGTRFLVFGSSIEGLMGGLSAVTAMSQLYLSDVTYSGTRSRLFSLMTGCLFAGIAIGPSIGGVLTVATGDVLITLGIATAMHVFILVAFPLVPDSVAAERRHDATMAHRDAAQARRLRAWIVESLMTPLTALAVLKPRHTGHMYEAVTAGTAQDDVHRPGSRYDASLCLLSIAYALESACTAIVSVKIQYVQMVFGWHSDAVGFFMSYSAVTRMVTLMAVIPILVKVLHQKPATIVLPQDAVYTDGPLDNDGRCMDVAAQTRPWTPAEHKLEAQWMRRAADLRLINDSRMDVCVHYATDIQMSLALGSAALTIVASLVTAWSRTDGGFLLGVLMTSLGSGIGPAITSLGLAMIHNPSDSAAMFGAWAVLSTIGGSIVGPSLFSAVFRSTASTSPGTVFVCVGVIQVFVIACLYGVRLKSADMLEGLPPRPQSPSAV